MKKDVQAQGGWLFDWHHILAVFVLLPLAVLADHVWQTVYLFLLGIYFIQYAGVERFKTGGWLGAAICLTVAVWTRSDDLWSLAAALASILLLAAMCTVWSRKYRRLRMLIPFLLFEALRILYTAAGQTMGIRAEFCWLLLGYLAALAVWDLKRRDDFLLPVLLIGTVAHIQYNIWGSRRFAVPFLLVLSAYTLIWGYKGRRGGYPLAGIFLLAGTHAQLRPLTDNGVVRAAMLNLVLWMQMAAAKAFQKKGEQTKTKIQAESETGAKVMTGAGTGRPVYWDICECALILLMMGEFYWDARPAIGNVFLLLAVFSASYVWLYKGKRAWPHLLTTLSMLPLPLALAVRYGLSEMALYGGAAAFLGAAFCLRFWFPILKPDESAQGGWLIDWYHILSFFVITQLAFGAGKVWQSVYLLLLGAYFWQYSQIPKLRRFALSVSGIFWAAAVWKQPFFVWPRIIETEIRMLLTAFLIFWFGRCFGKSGVVARIQAAGYVGCLTVLCFDACRTGRIEDALMLEGVCLGIFMLAQVKRQSMWMRISGFFVVAVSLYMTKGFWLNIAWWVYLLMAGLGLILFAAVSEKRKK